MKIITVSGPASAGKTSLILHLAEEYKKQDLYVGVAKFDCLSTEDDKLFRSRGIPVLTGLSGNLCPDHFYVASVIDCAEWGRKKGLDILFLESAGLCNRCSPHLLDIASVCVIDNLMSARSPHKIGPMLKKADFVAVTKGDIVSQAEREVFAYYISQANPTAMILPINGITGQGCREMAALLLRSGKEDVEDFTIRFTMPAAVCAYCVGQRHLQQDSRLTTMREMQEYGT